MSIKLSDKEAKKINSNIWKLYAYWFFHGLIFAYVIERLFELERGLTVQEMVYLEVIFATTLFIMEVPTGALADSWSRRKTMILSGVFTFMEFFVLIFAHHFWVFAISAIVAGIQNALSSGTSNAILYESLKSVGEEERFEEVLAKEKILSYISGGTAALIGGVLASVLGLTSTYWFSLIGVILSIFFAISLYEPKVHMKWERDNCFTHMKEAGQFLRKHESILFLTFFSLIVGAILNYLFEYWQIYLTEIGVTVVFFGLVSLLLHVVTSVPAVLVPKMRKRLGYRLSFSLIIIFGSIGLLLASMLHTWFGLIPLAVVYLGFGLVEPLFTGYLHHQIDSDSRATIESFTSLISTPISITIGLGFGWITTRFNIFGGIRFLGLLALGYALYYLVFQFKYLPDEKGLLATNIKNKF